MMRTNNFSWAILALAVWGTLAMPLQAQVNTSPARINLEQLKKLQAANAVLVVDVRPALEYQAGHIPGAISAPLDTLMTRAVEFKKVAKPIVAYCT